MKSRRRSIPSERCTKDWKHDGKSRSDCCTKSITHWWQPGECSGRPDAWASTGGSVPRFNSLVSNLHWRIVRRRIKFNGWCTTSCCGYGTPPVISPPTHISARKSWNKPGGKHNLFTHVLEALNWEICKRRKITRALSKRNPADSNRQDSWSREIWEHDERRSQNSLRTNLDWNRDVQCVFKT